MNLFVYLFVLLTCSSCSKKSPEYFQKRGKAITEELIIELQRINDVDELVEALPRLTHHFDALCDVMIEARKWQMKTKKSFSVVEDDPLNKKLMVELNRLLRNPLARHFLEKCQQPALEKLDAFEKRNKLYALE